MAYRVPALWNKFLEVVSSEVKTVAREGTGDREFVIYLLICSSELPYLQLKEL